MSELLGATIAVLNALPTSSEAILTGSTTALEQHTGALEAQICRHRPGLIVIGARRVAGFETVSAIIVVAKYARRMIFVMGQKCADLVARTEATRTRGFVDSARNEVDLEVSRLTEYLESTSPPAPPEPPTIYSHGNRTYSIDRVTPVVVTEEQDNILTACTERGTAIATKELSDLSGVLNVAAAIKRLRTGYDGRFAPAITAPGRKGAGGYLIRVRQLL